MPLRNLHCNPGKLQRGIVPLGKQLAHGDYPVGSGCNQKTSARNDPSTQSMSLKCSLKQHKGCPKKWDGRCTCTCHKSVEDAQVATHLPLSDRIKAEHYRPRVAA